MNFEVYRDNLKELIKWFSNHLGSMNEADTRFKLIDRLLFECLAWERDDFKSEEALDSEYADYTFYLSQRRVFILEAKRESISFELPAGFDNRTEYKLSSLLRDNADLAKAVSQVIGYCNQRGVEIAAVSNGFQLIAFLAHRNDGIAPLDGKALVFYSLESMEKNFLLLWQMLSRDGIREKRIVLNLQDSELPVLPLKLSTSIDNYPMVARRNELQTDLQIVSEVILENVNKNEAIFEDFLKETYCTSGALSQYALVSRSMLNNRYALLFEDNTPGPTVKEALSKKGLSPEVFAESLSSRPILLLGDVGSGKSMFINYFMNIEATEIIKKSFSIYVDLGSKAALASDLKEFFLSDLIRIFLDKYKIDFYEKNFVRGVYDLELIRFSKGIYSDLKISAPVEYAKEEILFLKHKIDYKEEHIRNCLEHITKGWKKQVIIFIDNVDQRDEHVQEHAFLIANEVAANWPATIFLTLRPTTYYKSKKVGALTGYHPKAFTISPPRVDEVILRRLAFALKIAQGEIESKTLSNVFSVNLITLTDFLKILIASFKQNTELIEFIDNICYGNIRKAIEYLATFIGSGHINTKKILSIDAQNAGSGHYIVSIHEFMRAIIYKEHQYFYPDATEIINIFDVYSEAREHFLVPMLLDFLLRNGTTHRSDGFIPSHILIEYLQDEGFKYQQIDHAILKSVYKGLVETEARKILNSGDAMPQALRITTIGSYHLQKLIQTFIYIDAIVVDVPIFSLKYQEKIKDVDHISERLERGQFFCDYLTEQWTNANFKKTGFDWQDVGKKLNEEFSYIQSRIR